MKQSKTLWFFSISIVSVLFAGLVLSLIHLRVINDLRSKANTSSTVLVKCDVDKTELEISQEEQGLLNKINNYRQTRGLNTLRWSNALVRGATWMSMDMLLNDYLNHTDSLGRDMQTRIMNCGYADFGALGENIDSGSKDSGYTFESWQHSPAHNANMLNPNFNEAGIALVADPGGTRFYWTLKLARDNTLITPTVAPSAPSATPQPGSGITPPVGPSGSPSIAPTAYPPSTPTPKVPTPVPTSPYPGYVPSAKDMQLWISAKVAGIGKDGNRSPKRMTRGVTVKIYNMKNKLTVSGYGFLLYDGADLFKGVIHFGPIANGTYFIKVQSDYMLQSTIQPTFQQLDINKLNMMPIINLIQGDLNKDNVVNIKDFNIALGCFRDDKCPEKNLIDFNDDGQTNIVDYNLLLNVFWELQGD